MRFIPISDFEKDSGLTFRPIEDFEVRDTGDDAERLAMRYKAPEPLPPEPQGLISRAFDAVRGTVSSIPAAITEKFTPYKSVMETYQPTVEEQQAELNKRLSYGAGPVSLQTVAKADEMRRGMIPIEQGPVLTVAKAREQAKETSFFDLVDKAKEAETFESDTETLRRQRVAEESPLTGALQAGMASSLAGTINAPTFAAQLFNDFAVNPLLKAAGMQPLPKVGQMFGTEYLTKSAAEYMPKINSRSSDGAIAREEFGKWLGVKLAANLQSTGMSMAAMFAPPLRAVLLPSMGATSAGQSYVQGDPAMIAAAKGLIEVGTEMLPLKVFDKIGDALKGLSPLKQSTVLAVAGQRLLQAGGQQTITSVTNAIEETAAQFGGNVLDKYFQGKDIELTKGLKDAAIVGAVSGSIISSPQTAGVLTGRYEPQNQIAQAINENVANIQFTGIDELARQQLSPFSNAPTNLNIGKINVEPVDTSAIFTATDASSAATAAAELAGGIPSVNLPPINLQPLDLPGQIEPTLTGLALPPLPPAVEPALTDLALPPLPPAIEPALDLNAPLQPDVATEQQFGLDKLRLTPPRPQKIQGQPVADLTDDQLTTIAGDETIPAITRRSASVELTARQNEAAGTTLATGLETAPSVPLANAPTEQNAGIIADRTLALPESQVPSTAIAPVGGESAAVGARATAQAAIDRWATANGVETPAVFNAAPAELDSAVNQIGEALNSQFGGKLYAYIDPRPNSLNGVAIGGAAFVNTANVDVNVARTSIHEFHHTVEQIAKLEARQGLVDTPAQQYVASVNTVFDDMTEDGKRSYLVKFLNAEELAGIADPVAKEQRIQDLMASPTTRSEMVADFLGNRSTDKEFWKDLAATDPKGFKGFVDKWLGIVDNMLSVLKGTPTQGQKESALVDTYIRDLGKAKVVARDALIAYSKGTLNADTTGTQGIPELAASNRPIFGTARSSESPEYGTAREGAVSVVAQHFSTQPRTSLNGAYYGTGLKGAERDRLDGSPDPRLKNRVYFYVDQGAGVRPEAGVGGVAHEAKLNNIYDPETKLIPPKGSFNAFESAVINAGFDGYLAPFGNNQSAVVLLGPRHSAVPVRSLGSLAGAPAPTPAEPTTLKKGLLSKELSTIEAARVPGARIAGGNLEIPATSREVANAELERIGSDVRFSKPQTGEPLSKAVKAEGVRAAAIVSSKPGREFKVGDETVNIIKYPKAKDLEFVTSRLHARVRDVLTGSDAITFLAESFALKGPSFKNPTTIRGLWAGEREDTFAVVAANADGSPASFENSRKLANLLGFGFIQEGAVTIEPSHGNNGGIPSMLIGKPDGSKLTRSEIDSALSAANSAGFFGASEALSGEGIKFLFFADDSSTKSNEEQYKDFVDQVGGVQQSTGLTAAGSFNTNSELDGANDYWTNATGQPLSANLGGAGDQAATGGSPNLFRGTVDNLLAPYISAITTEGFEFDVSQWQRVFGATDAQTAYLKLKITELDNINKHGVVPKLRQRVPITNLKQVGSRALLTQKTTEANAAEQLDVLDRVLAASSNPVKSTEAWLRMEAMAYGTNDVPMAPNRFIQMYNSDGIYEQLKGLSPGQVSDAQHGAEMGQEFRRLYESGKVKPEITAKLMLWSFLSRGVSPFVQESAFVDLVDKIDPFIPRVLDGTFSDEDANAWNKIVSETIKKGTGQPGAGTTHNANAFGASFMRGMAAPAPNGQTKMQYLHGLFSDPSKSGSEIRREFVKIGAGVGIDNKVISFTLLVIGHDDVAVLDRVQIANTYNDGRLGDYNLYDGIARYGYKDNGKMVWVGSTEGDYATAQEQAPDGEVISAKVPGSGMANLTTGARGLMIYEPLESALQKVLPGIFDRLKADGLRSQNTRATVGRWHWESWVAYSGQEASHKTLEALLAEAKGAKNPFSDVSAKEGEYGAFSYGTEYARDASGKAYKLYHDSTGKAYRFTLDSYKELMSEIKKKGKDGVVPTSFRVSTNEDGTQRSKPWFKDPRVDLTKFDEAIHRLGALPNISASERQGETTVAIFEGLGKRGLAKAKAETALRNHPNAAKMQYIQNNFLDILDELDTAGLVEINC